ncbi:MAG: hypothetical protein KDB87_20920 [Flavobacteriales bacterium]|nr:hypothetical protein [Flavobacteriales bacterium]MCB0815615.1 hypothetical protein [Flavobacteriales bacterium]
MKYYVSSLLGACAAAIFSFTTTCAQQTVAMAGKPNDCQPSTPHEVNSPKTEKERIQDCQKAVDTAYDKYRYTALPGDHQGDFRDWDKEVMCTDSRARNSETNELKNYTDKVIDKRAKEHRSSCSHGMANGHVQASTPLPSP